MDHSLSELENCALAVVWRDGPLTAYQVRTIFLQSITASWRASTGSIYPLVRKLEKLGLLAVQQVEDHPRKARVLKITPLGRKQLTNWLRAEPKQIADPVADPIRTRFYFLNAADKRTRRTLLQQWIDETEQNIGKAKQSMAQWQSEGKTLAAAAQQGALMQLQARRKWLIDYVRAEFD